MTVSGADLEALLAPVAAGLAADGYALTADVDGEGRVVVRVAAGAAPCEDCLVPKEVMQGIIAATLKRQGHDAAGVVVEYPADAGA